MMGCRLSIGLSAHTSPFTPLILKPRENPRSRHAFKLGQHLPDHVFTNIRYHHIEGVRPHRIHAPHKKWHRTRRLLIDIASDHPPRAQQLRRDGQNPRPAPYVQHRIARTNRALHCLQTQSSAGMLARAALQSGIYFEPDPALRSWLRAPGSHPKKSLAHEQRRPGIFRLPHPIDLRRWVRLTEHPRHFLLLEERV